jgi:hypothetical protein
MIHTDTSDQLAAMAITPAPPLRLVWLMLTTQGRTEESKSTMTDGSITRQKTLINSATRELIFGASRKNFGLLKGQKNDTAIYERHHVQPTARTQER